MGDSEAFSALMIFLAAGKGVSILYKRLMMRSILPSTTLEWALKAIAAIEFAL